MAYPMYGNNNQYYMQSLQDMKNNIEEQMRRYQQNQMQMQQPVPTNLTQNFQLAPQQTNNELECKYVNDINDVKNIFVMKTGIFINKDFSNLYVKDTNGNIRTFKTEEIIEVDEKDREIQELKRQIEEMKGMIINEYDSTDIVKSVENKKSTGVQSNKRTNTK